jgi:nucleoside-triphosphatase
LTTLSGETANLASVHIAGGPRVSRYGVNAAAMDDVATPAIERAIADARLIVIDEIGKMELLSNRFRQAVLAALECGKPVLATIMLAPHPCRRLKRRPDVALVSNSRAQERPTCWRRCGPLRAKIARRVDLSPRCYLSNR